MTEITCADPEPYLSIMRASEAGDPQAIARASLEGLSTHWDWWITLDEGGPQRALEEIRRWVEDNPHRWHVAIQEGKPVGAAGYAPHPRRTREIAWLAGVAVTPSYRLKGIGRALLCRLLSSARDEGFKEAVVYTYSPLLGLAPGATLYVKSRGLIQAEYIHFEKVI